MVSHARREDSFVLQSRSTGINHRCFQKGSCYYGDSIPSLSMSFRDTKDDFREFDYTYSRRSSNPFRSDIDRSKRHFLHWIGSGLLVSLSYWKARFGTL